MLISRRILNTLPKRRLIALAQKLGFSGITALSKNEIIGKLPRNRKPKEILEYLKLYEIKPVCSDIDLDLNGVGRRQEFIKLILRTERKAKSKRIETKKIKPRKRRAPIQLERPAYSEPSRPPISIESGH